jgi:hypothetical protein
MIVMMMIMMMFSQLSICVRKTHEIVLGKEWLKDIEIVNIMLMVGPGSHLKDKILSKKNFIQKKEISRRFWIKFYPTILKWPLGIFLFLDKILSFRWLPGLSVPTWWRWCLLDKNYMAVFYKINPLYA